MLDGCFILDPGGGQHPVWFSIRQVGEWILLRFMLNMVVNSALNELLITFYNTCFGLSTLINSLVEVNQAIKSLARIRIKYML